MKLVCSKANLLNGVQTVSKAVPSKTTMSILECILVDATNGEIKLTANDMELGIETTIEGQIIEKGIIALDAKIFLEIVRKLPDSDITIDFLIKSSSYNAPVSMRFSSRALPDRYCPNCPQPSTNEKRR